MYKYLSGLESKIIGPEVAMFLLPFGLKASENSSHATLMPPNSDTNRGEEVVSPIGFKIGLGSGSWLGTSTTSCDET